MGSSNHSAVAVVETHVKVSMGEVFVRQWSPPESAATPLLLLHDSLGSVAQWRAFPQLLAQHLGRRVIAYDRLGFGQSTPRQGAIGDDFIVVEALSVLPQLLDALEVDACIPLGHSVGGAMAIQLAARHPQRCPAVITESAQPYVEDLTLEGIRDAKRAFEQPEQFARLERWHGERARWVLDAWTGSWLSTAFRDWSLDDCLSEVVCPLLALHGDSDEFGTVNFPEYIADAVAGPSRCEIIAGCGHVPHRDKPDEVLRRIARFLSQYQG